MTSTRALSRTRRRAGRSFAIVFGVILLAVVAAAVWLGVRGAQAYQHLTDARAAASGASETLSDPTRAADLIADISAHTRAARDLTGDPVWRMAEHLPWVGPQLNAVSTVTVAIDDLASEALTPLADAAASVSLESLTPVDGAIDLSVFEGLDEAAATGAKGVADAADAIEAIDTEPLIGEVRDAVDEVSALLAEAEVGADALQRAVTLMPAMLGADGPRDYLVVFQNNAEWRSGGGIVGAMVVISTDDGRISLTGQGSSSDFTRFDEPVLPLDDETQQLFGRYPALFVQNPTQLPDFTQAAPILQEMWRLEMGTELDGVLSLDPVALAYILEATGPITLLTGEELTSDNAVDLLLNEVYFRYEQPAMQDAFFAAAAASVFDTLAGGGADPAALLDSLAQAGSEHRLRIWNSDAGEQAVLDGTTLQGTLPETDASTTSFGVFANDGTASKMNYYTDLAVTHAWCGPGDEAELTVSLSNDAPADAATSLPNYITGGGHGGVEPGDVETLIYIYLPEGAQLLSTQTTGDGESSGLGTGSDRGRQVVVWPSTLAPGETMTFEVRVATPRTAELLTQVTPTVSTDNMPVLAQNCGSS